MKSKIKEMLSCMLLGLYMAIVIYVAISVSCETMTRLEGFVIMGISAVPTFGLAFGIKEEK